MDRSLVEKERGRSCSARRRSIGITMPRSMMQPHNGTRIAPEAWACRTFAGLRSRDAEAGGYTASVAIRLSLVCMRDDGPSADATRNPPSQRPFAQHTRPTRS
jgi:hypothetical protein